jgi:hypothetical protein
MLMSDMADCVFPFELKAMLLSPAEIVGRRWWRLLGAGLEEGGVLDGVEELATEVVHAGAELAEAAGELVVAHDGGDGDDEAGGGGDEGFGDAGGNGAEGSSAFVAQAVERVDDAHDGAEEADEGADLRDGGEPCHSAFHEGEGFGGGSLGGALEALRIWRCAAAAGLALVLVVDFVEDVDERAGLELLGDGCDFREAAGLAEGAQEAAILDIGCLERSPLGDHDGPGDYGHHKQKGEHGEGRGAAVVQHLHEGAGGLAVGGGAERSVGGNLRGGILEEESEG